ncbi:hypothetical protein Pcinc_026417 [Petrolisthes cinctipes]|uniref:G-protein coupled receptors family 2 profile 2 domain-containing protein n=1 Tax=Petrolisthes cinctipes TaxID=88211 RepID=A0AAE1F7B9_PETCI|nr:hypothetical protein Pcinc_026417 [Petrolisthes cinctipes]
MQDSNVGRNVNNSDTEQTRNNLGTTAVYEESKIKIGSTARRPGTEPPLQNVNKQEADTQTEASEVQTDTKEAKELILVDGKVPSNPSQLIKCQCSAKEVLTKDGCQTYQGDTFIVSKDETFKLAQIPVGSVDVVIHEPECKTVDGHRQMNFSKDEFYLRKRGVVEYTANFCFSDPMEVHNKACQGHICIRKCCKHGQIMSTTLYRCIDKENSTFSPPFIAEPSSFKVVHGYPLCLPKSREFNISIDNQGHLLALDRTFQPIHFCVDEFSDGKGTFKQGALLCPMITSEWDKVQIIAFPVCQAISLVFLALTVVCYCLVPVLLQQGGWCQLFHVLSMILAYSSGIAQQTLSQDWDNTTCIAMAIVMQFGYLCTFFWLSVLCFKVWRNIRSLYKFLPAANLPLWIYSIYGFGGPSIICIVTLCLHSLVPDGAVGVIKPGLGVSRCWFSGTMETLVFFYGPVTFLLASNIVFIVHTFWFYRRIVNNISTTQDLWVNGPGSEANKAPRIAEQTNRKRDSVADFKQQFSLLVLMCVCWVTEILSWKIPPPELWALGDILNALQGFFVFVIVISNRRKRMFMKKKFPWIFSLVKKVMLAVCPKSCHRDTEKETTPSIASSVSVCSSLSASPKLTPSVALHLASYSSSNNTGQDTNSSSSSPVTEGSS